MTGQKRRTALRCALTYDSLGSGDLWSLFNCVYGFDCGDVGYLIRSVAPIYLDKTENWQLAADAELRLQKRINGTAGINLCMKTDLAIEIIIRIDLERNPF